MFVSRAGHKIDFQVDQSKVDEILSYKKKMGEKFPKIGVLVLSYNASKFIKQTIERIPKELGPALHEIFIFDDNSPDNTFSVAELMTKSSSWKNKLSAYRNPKNLRYGGNQKVGYRYAIEQGLDYVIMLHGDGQYAPEYIPDLILPCLEDQKEVVFASRMIDKKAALRGGMPFYKFVGNQVLTTFENLMLGTSLHEFHSGYRLYSTEVLKKIPFEENTNEFHFDTQIIIQCRALGVTIHEVPIKTFYGDEECNVDGLRYAWDVCVSVLGYRLHQLHIVRNTRYFMRREFVYVRKKSPTSSHEKILSMLKPQCRILDLGSGAGKLSRSLEKRGHDVVSIDEYPVSLLDVIPEKYLQHNLDDYKAIKFDREFDYILLSEILPKIKDHEGFLRYIQKFLKEDGRIIVCLPNIGIWFYRLSLLVGRFNYGDRGILDRKNLHLFTKATARHLLESNGLKITKRDVTGIPFEVLFESIGQSKVVSFVAWFYYLFAKSWHKLFAYQFILEGEITYLNYEEGEGKSN